MSLRQRIDSAIQEFIIESKPKFESTGLIELHRAMGYSLTSGGNRLRPMLVCLTAQALQTDVEKVLPFAVALELVHTYSLIHDDLPSMDNDDFRRGQPANHKVFGEPLAILAGDALCTEPYGYIAHKYEKNPELALELIKTLVFAAGSRGMVGGQAIDIYSKGKSLSLKDVEFLHQCKTVALFEAAVSGAAIISGASEKIRGALKKYAGALGLMFQIADDIHDDQSANEPSYVRFAGLEKTQKYCEELKDRALQEVQSLGTGGAPLIDFTEKIFERTRDVIRKGE